jgi:hypothetical protein
VARAENTDGPEEAQTVSEARPTDAQSFGQFTFGRQAIAGLETALPDHFSNLSDDLFGYQPGFFWSDHPKSAETNFAALVSTHLLKDSAARNYFQPKCFAL